MLPLTFFRVIVKYMTIFEALIFGVVQGLTEFLPVSSSGHLVVLHHFFGNGGGDVSFDVMLHLATLLAVVVYFRKDIEHILRVLRCMVTRQHVEEREKKLIYALILGTIPAGLLGALFASPIESMFRSTASVAAALIFGSIIFVVAERVSKRNKEITEKRGFLVGCFQALALIPGISRSGATISGGLILGFTREEAVRFSFLLSVPIILGAGLVEILGGSALILGTPVIFGAVAAFLSGLWAISFLVKFLKGHTLMPFVWYRVVLALFLILMF